MATQIDNENFRSGFAILADAQNKQRELFRKESQRLVEKLFTEDHPAMERFKLMVDLGKIGKALLAMHDIHEATVTFQGRDPVKV